MKLHHQKHHQAYVNGLNAAEEWSGLAQIAVVPNMYKLLLSFALFKARAAWSGARSTVSGV